MEKCARRVKLWPCLVWACFALAAHAAPRAEQQAEPVPKPEATPPPEKPKPLPLRLRLEVAKHAERIVAEQEKNAPPRFETSIEVVGKSPQIMLDRFFGGLDLECGPAAGGAPTEAEMRAYRVHPAPYVDFLTLARALVSRLKGKGPDRYFLYQVRRADGVNYVLREARIPAVALYVAGTMYELVEAYPDLDSGTKAWRRLERGFQTPTSSVSASPPPPWVTTNCRPRRN